MKRPLPLGKREGRHLEFKGRSALAEPEGIARVVVGMLNAEGGDVWVGIREEGAWAIGLEPIPEPASEERRLRDYLVDAIEPSLTPDEIDIETCVGEGGEAVLRLHVEPVPAHQPYALVSRGGRYYLTRVGALVSPMSRQAIAHSFLSSAMGEDAALERAIARVLDEREGLQEQGGELFWLRLEPAANAEIDFQRFQDYLIEPTLSGNRRTGWSFVGTYFPPEVLQDKLVSDTRDPRGVEIRRDGGLVFKAPLSLFHWKGQAKELWPTMLLEYPISAFRLAKVIYSGILKGEDPVVADLALLGVNGWILRPNSPGTLFTLNNPHVYRASENLVWEKPLVFTFKEIEDQPDLCGYRLVKRVYEAFDIGEEQIPKEFDRKSGRLVLPD